MRAILLLPLLVLVERPLRSRPSAAPTAPKVVRATYTVEDITLAFQDAGRKAGPVAGAGAPTFTVGLLVVNFNRPVHVRRNLNAAASTAGRPTSILDDDFYPEELGESFFGLTRLDCPQLGLALPSFLPNSSASSSAAEAPPQTLTFTTISEYLQSTLPKDVILPMAHAERYDLAWLLATLALERYDDNRRMRLGASYYDAEQDPHRRYVALYFGSDQSRAPA